MEKKPIIILENPEQVFLFISDFLRYMNITRPRRNLFVLDREVLNYSRAYLDDLEKGKHEIFSHNAEFLLYKAKQQLGENIK